MGFVASAFRRGFNRPHPHALLFPSPLAIREREPIRTCIEGDLVTLPPEVPGGSVFACNGGITVASQQQR
jgi:hypothetical protein